MAWTEADGLPDLPTDGGGGGFSWNAVFGGTRSTWLIRSPSARSEFEPRRAIGIVGSTPPLLPPPVPGPVAAPTGGSYPPTLPGYSSPDAPSRIGTATGAAILARAVGFGIGLMFYPTEAGRGSDLRNVDVRDSYPYLLAVPAARPAGPSRRGRRRPVVPPPGTVARPSSVRPAARPVSRPSSGPVTISRPTIQAPAQVATGSQAPRPASLPAALPQIQVGPIISSAPSVGTIATPAAAPAVSPATPTILSTVVQWASNALPFLPLALPFAGASLLSSPSPMAAPALAPLTRIQPNAVTSQATAALPQSDACKSSKARQQRKRKRKPCKNPTVSSRLETKGGKRYQIIRRWLKCQGSSRKKRRLQPVR